jgi:hypothetical protein
MDVRANTTGGFWCTMTADPIAGTTRSAGKPGPQLHHLPAASISNHPLLLHREQYSRSLKER